jgi:quercetin dioxygenase-like cupin family protein
MLRLALLAFPLASLIFPAGAENVAAAQYERRTDDLLTGWENDRVRLDRITIEPGATLPDPGTGAVLVYLTADEAGRFPSAEAVWRPAGSGGLQNTGKLRMDAIAIQLKEVQTGAGGGTPAEAVVTSDRAETIRLIDNPRVLVTKHRYAPATYVDPLHFHASDVLVVYLRGGRTWPAVGTWGSYQVRRGEVDVIPANTFHTLGNAGSDPLEFLVIVPR